MKYIVQIDFQLCDVTTDDGKVIEGVIATRKMDVVAETLMSKLVFEVSQIQVELNARTQILDLKAFAVESFEDIEHGNIYY